MGCIGHVNRETFAAVFDMDTGGTKKIICLPGTLALSNAKFYGMYFKGIWKQASCRLLFLLNTRRGVCEDGVTRNVTLNRFLNPRTKRWEFMRDSKGKYPYPEDDFNIFLDGQCPP